MSRYIAGSVIMTLLVAVYLGFAVVYAQVLLVDDSLLVNAMGAALLVFPIVGAWGLVLEWRFGFASSKLIKILGEEGRLPDDDFPTKLSGRPIKEQALETFPAFQQDAEENPESWRAGLRQALAYDACGERRRAWWATRKAIALSKRHGD